MSLCDHRDEWVYRTQGQLFNFVFRLQQGRQPDPWETTLGQALVDGTLKVVRIPDAEELRRVHYAAYGTRAALGMFDPSVGSGS